MNDVNPIDINFTFKEKKKKILLERRFLKSEVTVIISMSD